MALQLPEFVKRNKFLRQYTALVNKHGKYCISIIHLHAPAAPPRTTSVTGQSELSPPFTEFDNFR